MKVKKYKSDKEISINIRKYLIDWDNAGSSSLEICFKEMIKPYWYNSIILYQYRIPGSLLRLDFLNINKRLSVEIDGNQHNQFNKHFHANSRANYLASIKRDLCKEEWLEKNNIKLLRLNEYDLYNFSPKYIERNFGINII